MNESPVVLLVDDSRFFLGMERRFLNATPAEVLEARSAAEALDAARKRRPDLVYMDLNLQGESGSECCRKFKTDPALRSVPIILLCDEAEPDQMVICREAGCEGVLTKPLDRRRFLELGRSLLAGIRDRRQSCLLRVRFRIDGRICVGRALDISPGGLFLQTRERLKSGDVIMLDVQLSRPEEPGDWIACTAAVVWVNTSEKPFRPEHPVGYGVRFTVVSDQATGALKEFLKKPPERNDLSPT